MKTKGLLVFKVYLNLKGFAVLREITPTEEFGVIFFQILPPNQDFVQ